MAVYGTQQPLAVGRYDRSTPAPPRQLPAGDQSLPAGHQSLQDFATFWTERGFSMEEAVALQGSHALIDDQVCGAGRPRGGCMAAAWQLPLWCCALWMDG